MGMGRFSELVWATKEGPPPTPRETAERWIKALSGSEPVDTAQAEAEVDFRKKERLGNWRESIGKVGFVPEPEHWPAGAEYTRRMFAGYAQAAFAHIHKPREFESFLHESLAILSEGTYRQKLRPYECVLGTDAEARGIAGFHESVRTAASEDVNRWADAGWERHKERCRQKAAERAASVAGRSSQAEPAAAPPSITEALRSWCDVLGKGTEPAAAPPTVTEAELPAVRGEAPPTKTAALTEATANGKTAEPREVRLQAFIHQHNTSIAAVSEAAAVHKPDMQHWRHDELSDDSVMSRRIENVLSGKTQLKAGDAKPAPAA